MSGAQKQPIFKLSLRYMRYVFALRCWLAVGRAGADLSVYDNF
jgi:hypothetical protein